MCILDPKVRVIQCTEFYIGEGRTSLSALSESTTIAGNRSSADLEAGGETPRRRRFGLSPTAQKAIMTTITILGFVIGIVSLIVDVQMSP